MAYDPGDLVRCTATFQNPATDAYVDPSTVAFKYRNGNGTVTTLTYGADVSLVKDSTGIYHVDVDAATAGTWHYRFESTGTYKAAQEGTFTVTSGSF